MQNVSTLCGHDTDMRKGLVFVLTICLCLAVHAQQNMQAVVIEQAAQNIAVDPQGYVYAINDASLYKYAPDGKLLYSYNNNLLGNISSIDVDNPLKIMLFYRDAGSILFLDDKLAPIGDLVDLFSKGLTTISLATYSTKNELILYDESNTDLIFLDFYFREKERIHYDFKDFQPILLTNINEKMTVMQDPRQGIFFFDNFGTFEKNIAVLSAYPIQILKDRILYINNNQLNSYSYLQLEWNPLCDLAEKTIQVLIYQNNIILTDGKTIKIQALNQNKP